MAGRTVQRWARFYMDGYDMSCYSRSIGPLRWQFDEADLTTLCDSVKGYLPAACDMSPTSLNGNLDNTATSGLHVIASGAGVSRVVTVAFGQRAAPAAGDPVYVGRYQQVGYTASEEGGAMTVNIPFDGWDAGNMGAYENPWGTLLRANSATVGANTASGIDGGAATTLGGYMVYHVTAGNGTATISIDDSANNTDWLALSGATTGELDCSTVKSGIVALGNTATVRRYLRWQIALNSATSVTFVLSFVRGIHV